MLDIVINNGISYNKDSIMIDVSNKDLLTDKLTWFPEMFLVGYKNYKNLNLSC